MVKKKTYEELEKRINELEQRESCRDRINDELQESETLFNTLLENLPAGVIVVDPLTRIIESVDRARAILGIQ